MADERSVFERLDKIELISKTNNEMIARLLGMADNNQFSQTEQTKKQSEKEIFQQFLKKAKKSWRWFGTNNEFEKKRAWVIISLLVLIVFGVLATIASSICFDLYSTFTLFENIWIICGIIYLVHVSRAQLTYEVSALAVNSPLEYESDEIGMLYFGKEKKVFRVFKWLAIISVICNIIAIWTSMGKSNQIVATIFEVLFLITIIISYIVNMVFFADYSIMWIEGHNATTKKKVVLVLPPFAEQFMLEEEFKKKIPFLYE